MGRLREIQEEMLELLEEAKGIVTGKRKMHPMVYERMKAYWHGSIQMGLTTDNDYIGGAGATMEEAIAAIEGDGDGVDDLVNYAGDDFDTNALREEIDGDLPADSTLEQVVAHGLKYHDADRIRDYIDKVNA
jgi:hypothetical protein